MKKVFDLNDKVGEIVTVFPKAMDVFLKSNIDFCCGGHRTLEEVTKDQNLNGVALIEVLNKKYASYKVNEKEVNFSNYSKEELISHIIEVHHEYLRSELPQISKLVNKIYEVHGDKHPEVLKTIREAFHLLKADLEEHLIKEEEILFPLAIRYEQISEHEERERIAYTIRELEQEHEQAGDILKLLRQVTNNYEIPDDVCQTYAFTYQKLEELELDMFQHIHLENNILFKNIII